MNFIDFVLKNYLRLTVVLVDNSESSNPSWLAELRPINENCFIKFEDENPHTYIQGCGETADKAVLSIVEKLLLKTKLSIGGYNNRQYTSVMETEIPDTLSYD